MMKYSDLQATTFLTWILNSYRPNSSTCFGNHKGLLEGSDLRFMIRSRWSKGGDDHDIKKTSFCRIEGSVFSNFLRCDYRYLKMIANYYHPTKTILLLLDIDEEVWMLDSKFEILSALHCCLYFVCSTFHKVFKSFRILLRINKIWRFLFFKLTWFEQ